MKWEEENEKNKNKNKKTIGNKRQIEKRPENKTARR